MLKARKDANTLTRWEIIMNPLYTLCDIPCLLMMVATLVISPWRLLTTFRYLCQHHSHFPDNKVTVIRYDLIGFSLLAGVCDYLCIP